MSVVQLQATLHTTGCEENAWQGPSSQCRPQSITSLSSERAIKHKAIKRKPPPQITPELLAELAVARRDIDSNAAKPLQAKDQISSSSMSANQLELSRSSETSKYSAQPSSSPLIRKTSMSAHLKNALRRRPSTVQESLATRIMTISNPTDVVHVSGRVNNNSMLMHSPQQTSLASERSLTASTDSADAIFRLSPLPEHKSLPNVDTHLWSSLGPRGEDHHPLRPTRSIRRPMQPPNLSSSSVPIQLATKSDPHLLDKRRAIYHVVPAETKIQSAATTPISTSRRPSVGRDVTWTLNSQARLHRDSHARASSSSSTAELEPELSRSPSSILSSSFESDDESMAPLAAIPNERHQYPRCSESNCKHKLDSSDWSSTASHGPPVLPHSTYGNFI